MRIDSAAADFPGETDQQMTAPRTTTQHLMRRARSGLWLAAVAGTVFLAGCGAVRDDEGHPLTTLNPKGPEARVIDHLSNQVFLVAGIVFVLVQGAVLFLVVRFRKRRVDDRPDPVQSHGNPRLEWAWTIAPALLLAGLAIGNVQSIWKLEERVDKPLKVEVIGQQWWWEYRYYDGDKGLDSDPIIITANQMVIPAGKQVDLTIRSNDVIHSFWIPALNGKKDAVPGRRHTLSMEADQPGVYQGTCTEFCGVAHAYMRMEVKALPADEWDEWVAAQRKPGARPKEGSKAEEGMKLFQSRCSMCHQVNQFDGDANGAVRTDLGISTSAAADASAEAKAEKDAEVLDEVARLDQVMPNPDYRGGREELTSANAPNLTHLMSRDRFAGNLFELYNKGEPNESELRNWLRDPAAKKPQRPDNRQGMPNLALTEDEIDKLVAYLVTLK